MRVAESGGFISGDMVKVQSDSLLSIIHEGRVSSLTLPAGAKILNHTAFLLEIASGFLAYQLNRASVSLSQFNLLASNSETAIFNFVPMINAAALSRLDRQVPKTFVFKVADPFDLEAVEDEQKELRESLMTMIGQTHGAYVKVQVGMGHKAGELDEKFLQRVVGWFLEQKAKKRGKVRALTVEGKEDGKRVDVLNFLRAHIGHAENVSLVHLTSQDERYQARAAFLQRAFERSRQELNPFRKL